MRRLSNTQAELMRRLRNGECLCVEKADDGEEHFFLSGGATVNRRTVAVLERIGRVRRAQDGLFGDGQTYEVVNV